MSLQTPESQEQSLRVPVAVETCFDSGVVDLLRSRVGGTVGFSGVPGVPNDGISHLYVQDVQHIVAQVEKGNCNSQNLYWFYDPSRSEELLRSVYQFPNAALCIVPAKKQWAYLTKGFTLVAQFSKNTKLLQNTSQLNLPVNAPGTMYVWYKPARVEQNVSSRELQSEPTYKVSDVIAAATLIFSLQPVKTHTFQFQGSLSGIKASVLCDSGAEHGPYLSADWCAKHNIKVIPIDNPIGCEGIDGSQLTVTGTAHLRLQIQSYVQHIKFTVVNLNPNSFDVILGDKWFEQVKADMQWYPEARLLIRTVKKEHVLIPTLLGSEKISHKPLSSPSIMSMNRVKHMMRKEDAPEVYLMMITESSVKTTGSSDQSNQLLSEDKVTGIIKDYPMVFTDKAPYGGSAIQIPEVIPTPPDARPISRPLFRYSPLEMAEIERQVTELLALGYIQPSMSPWGTPVLLVKKPHSTELRMCVDYRALNAITRRNSYPLPRIDDLISTLAEAKIFSSIDLRQAYHQLQLIPEDRPKTAFKTPFGLYEYRVLSFGLVNAPAAFQTVMNQIFRPYLNKFVVVYLDDIMVFSKTPEEHERHLRLVLDVLKDKKLTANVDKCNLNRNETTYLGHIISADGLKVDPAKISSIKSFPRPTDVKSLRSFLGMASYFRRFIKKFAIIARPLTDMLKKGVNVTASWSSTAEHAFTRLKEALSTAPVLTIPDWKSTEPFTMFCDGSYEGISGILLQNRKVVAYESRKLSPAEMRYSPTEFEMLAVDYCCQKWRCYIEGRKCIVRTDHKPNVSFPTQQMLTRRQARWLERLQGFDLQWDHIPGPDNIADALSRNPQPNSLLGAVITRAQHRRQNENHLTDNNDFLARLRQAYTTDVTFSADQPTVYIQEDGLYYLQDKLVIPADRTLINEVIQECHSSQFAGHLGRERTLRLVRRYFYWPKMHKDVQLFVQRCESCQRNKARMHKPSGLLLPLEIPQTPWQSISMDFITHLPSSRQGHTAIYVVVDRLTKMVRLAPCKDETDAPEVAHLFMENVVRHHGIPYSIISDRDSRFTSKFWEAFCDQWNIHHSLSTAFHPETNANTERMNRVVQEMLRNVTLPDQSDWDEHLYLVEFCINNAYNHSLKTTPFYLNYGRHPDIPIASMIKRHREKVHNRARYLQRTSAEHSVIDVPYINSLTQKMQQLVARAKQALINAQQRQKHYADLRRQEAHFTEGQQVLLSTKYLSLKTTGAKKLLPRFVGPFSITKVIQNPVSHEAVAVKLTLPPALDVHPVFHVSLIEPYRSDGNVHPPLPVLTDGELSYKVEKILNHRDRGRGKKLREFLVKWSGYDHAHNTWEPVSCLHDRDSSVAIQHYWATRKERTVRTPVDRSHTSKRDVPVHPLRPKMKRRSKRKVRLVLDRLPRV